MESHRVIRTAILDCDTPVPAILSTRGKYSDLFIALLDKVAPRTGTKLQYSVYDSVLGQYPTVEEVKNIDAIVITGSAASAYDTDPWISTLKDFLKEIYTSHPTIKIFGSCFGHQLLCHAIFSPPGSNIVCRDPAGWEVGVQAVTLSPAFLAQYGQVPSGSISSNDLRLQLVHADHVAISPSELPAGFHSIGRSKHCALQGVWQKGRVLTYQGHAEFDREVNRETLRVFGKLIWSEEAMREALEKVEAESDDLWAAEVIVRFFEEEADVEVGNGVSVVDGYAVERSCAQEAEGIDGAKSMGDFVDADGGEAVAVCG